MDSILPRFGLLLAVKWFFRRFFCVKLANMIPFLFVRIFLYRVMGVRIGRDVYIGWDLELDTNHPEMITIGNHVTISHRCTISSHTATPRAKALINQLMSRLKLSLLLCDA